MIKRILISILALLILLPALTGCQSSTALTDSSDEIMKRVIVDDAGRRLEIPEKIDRVFTTGLISSIFLYTLAPDKMIGWNNDLSEGAYTYIPETYSSLPVLGRFAGSSFTGSIEEILKLKPDVLINVGDINEEWVGISNEIQEQLGIPVIMIDGSFFGLSDAYKTAGDFLGASVRGNELAEYTNNLLLEMEKFVSTLAEKDSKTVYLASGMDGLETSGKGSLNVELLELMGSDIVVDVDSAGRIETTIEQVVLWNPDVIFVSDFSGINQEVRQLITAPESPWRNISAVANNQVHTIPNLPFDWINRPPSVMRIMGAQWIAQILHPQSVSWNVEERLVEFMKIYFNYDLSPAETGRIIP